MRCSMGSSRTGKPILRAKAIRQALHTCLFRGMLSRTSRNSKRSLCHIAKRTVVFANVVVHLTLQDVLDHGRHRCHFYFLRIAFCFELAGYAEHFRKHYFVNCWNMAADENVAMWERL